MSQNASNTFGILNQTHKERLNEGEVVENSKDNVPDILRQQLSYLRDLYKKIQERHEHLLLRGTSPHTEL